MTDMSVPHLPTRFSDARQFAGKGHIPKADSANTKFAHKSPGTAADGTPVVLAAGKLGFPLRLDHE
jgi:hypothetical protein